jgi:hypothetical protein
MEEWIKRRKRGEEMAKGPKGFIVLLPQAIIEIPQDSYLSYDL